MKSRKLRTVLIVATAIIFAYAVVLFVLTQVQTSKMDDPFARAEKQVFSLDADKITYIAVQNGNGELYEFTGGEKASAIDKLNAFEATKIRGMWHIEAGGWTYRLIIEDADGNSGNYRLFDNRLICGDVSLRGSDGYFDDLIKHVSLD